MYVLDWILYTLFALHYKNAYDRVRYHYLNFKDPPLLEIWEKAEIVQNFLQTFCIVTNVLFCSKYYTSNVFFQKICHILMLLWGTRKDDSKLLGKMAKNMLVKFQKYWVEKEPNILLSIVLALDTGFKF